MFRNGQLLSVDAATGRVVVLLTLATATVAQKNFIRGLAALHRDAMEVPAPVNP